MPTFFSSHMAGYWDTVPNQESVIPVSLTGYYSVITFHTKGVGSSPLGPGQRAAVIYGVNTKIQKAQWQTNHIQFTKEQQVVP